MLSDPFEVNVGVKQGCVLAPLLFNIYLAAVTLLSYNLIHQDDGITYRYRVKPSKTKGADREPAYEPAATKDPDDVVEYCFGMMRLD